MYNALRALRNSSLACNLLHMLCGLQYTHNSSILRLRNYVIGEFLQQRATIQVLVFSSETGGVLCSLQKQEIYDVYETVILLKAVVYATFIIYRCEYQKIFEGSS